MYSVTRSLSQSACHSLARHLPSRRPILACRHAHLHERTRTRRRARAFCRFSQTCFCACATHTRAHAHPQRGAHRGTQMRTDACSCTQMHASTASAPSSFPTCFGSRESMHWWTFHQTATRRESQRLKAAFLLNKCSLVCRPYMAMPPREVGPYLGGSQPFPSVSSCLSLV